MRKDSDRTRALTVSIVGAGNLGTALAATLPKVGCEVKFIATRATSGNQRHTRVLVRKLQARLVELGKEPLDTDLVWITVPDDSISLVARKLAGVQDWKGRIVFHSSGALTSDELAPLRAKGARVASVHPMMTFVRGSVPDMAGVAFAVEGDAAATRMARKIVERLGGDAVPIRKQNKVLYHAFGSFASPLVIALMASLEASGLGRWRQEARHQARHASSAIANVAKLSVSGCSRSLQWSPGSWRRRNRQKASGRVEGHSRGARSVHCAGKSGSEEVTGKESEWSGSGLEGVATDCYAMLVLPPRKQMPHLLFLRAHVGFGVLVRLDLGGDALHHFDSSGLDGGNLVRIVGDEANFFHA